MNVFEQTNKRGKSLAAVFAIAAAIQAPVNAGTVTLNFENVAVASTNKQNFVTEHVLFSPSCHFHIDNLTDFYQPAPYGKYLSWDNSGCYDDPNPNFANYYNHDYLGPSGWQANVAKMYVALEFGEVFTLQSLIFASRFDGGAYRLSSSKGGVQNVSYVDGNFTLRSFAGDEWTDITWLEFVRVGGSDIPWGFDDLTLVGNALPEPSSYGLAGIAALAAGAALRRRRQRP